jgi:hypothetical protein
MRLLLAILFGISARGQDSFVGSQACAGCHAEIFRGYQATGMARSSGRIGSGTFREKLPTAPILDKSSGATYQVKRGNDAYQLSFERPGAGITGSRDLKWFIGSGKVGRSYAFAVDGFLFQAPVSYYSSVARWDVSPGYSGKQHIELAKPIEEPCLYCHSSRVQAIANTQNRYQESPFLEGGVACERCHGPGQKHLQTHSDIVNPAKLDPARRDSICQQCHLTGAARVPKTGRGVGTFRPGDLLSDHLAVFVWNASSGPQAATDHSEQLARSKCKLASGDRLWCGTCHNPHVQPAAAAFRHSCLGCHATKPCALSPEARTAADDDCTACHMPKASSREGEHVAYTDHTIVRRRVAPSDWQTERTLRSFWPSRPEDRDLAIASASLGRAALPLLQKLQSSNDAPLLIQLGQSYDALGNGDLAESVYERALRIDPSNAAAGANLAIYRARKGRVAEAITLWRDVFSRNPALPGPGINLAIAQWEAGQRDSARETVQRLLQFHPDLEAVRNLRLRVR